MIWLEESQSRPRPVSIVFVTASQTYSLVLELWAGWLVNINNAYLNTKMGTLKCSWPQSRSKLSIKWTVFGSKRRLDGNMAFSTFIWVQTHDWKLVHGNLGTVVFGEAASGSFVTPRGHREELCSVVPSGVVVVGKEYGNSRTIQGYGKFDLVLSVFVCISPRSCSNVRIFILNSFLVLYHNFSVHMGPISAK